MSIFRSCAKSYFSPVKCLLLSLCLLVTALLSACGQSIPSSAESHTTRTITYLDQTYKVPVNPQRILLMSAFETMEDAVVLGVEPYASSAIGEEDDPFPGFYNTVMKQTIPLMGTTEDSLEYLLELNPDLILGTDMETALVHERLAQIAPTIPVSHFGPDWQANLELLAEITGKQDKAKEVILSYEQKRDEARKIVASLDSDIEVLAIRVRGEQMMIYPENVFLNDVLYEQLGFKVPDLISKTTQQEMLSIEGLSSVNPDYIFLQYDLYENGGSDRVLKDLQNSKVWQGLDAVKNNRLFINAIDPLISGGGTANGKLLIIQAVLDNFR